MANLYKDEIDIREGDSFKNSSIVLESWLSLPNYLIEISSPRQDLCVIYFSSNGIYFPSNEATFRERILSHNHFEWYKNRLSNADKHIFVRDVFEQWYLKGINKNIPNQDALLAFLKKESLGYKRVVTIGSSAGGYAAILFGCQLNAFKIFSFSPRISLTPLIEKASTNKNPILYALRGTEQLKNADLRQVVDMDSPNVICFFPIHSQFDIQQNALLNGFTLLRTIRINSKKHGVPIVKPVECLNVLLEYKEHQWIDICASEHSPHSFTFKVLGPIAYINFIYEKVKKWFINAFR